MATFSAMAMDCGATSGRAILGTLDDDGRLTMDEIHRWPNQIVTVDGRMQWEWERLSGEVAKGIELALQAGHAPSSVGVDTWGVDYLLIDDQGQPLDNPTAYRDARTEGMEERVWSQMPLAELYAITGIQTMPINTIYQLAAEKLNNAGKLQRARHLLLMPNAFAWKLGARPCAEYTIASTTQLLDARRRNWADTVLEKLGLPRDVFPEIVEPGSTIGEYEHDGKRLSIVATAGHDTAAAVAAIPAAGDKPWAYISSGTWQLVGVESTEPMLSDAALQAGLTNEGGVGGTYRLLTNITGLWLIEECMRLWRDAGDTIEITALVKAAEDAPADGPLVDPNDPRFTAPDDMPAAIAGYCNDHGMPPPADKAQTARCIFESLALKTREVLENTAGVTGTRPEVIHMVGGGSKNALLCQWIANVYGAPVVAGPAECTANGNVLVQAMAAGRVDGLNGMRQIVRRNTDLQEYQPAGDAYWQRRWDAFQKLNGS